VFIDIFLLCSSCPIGRWGKEEGGA
jgi:hypothetical protein